MPSPLCPVGKNIHNVLDVSYSKIRKDLQEAYVTSPRKKIIDNYHINVQNSYR